MISGVDTGVANTYVLTPSEPLTEYSTRMIVTFIPANTNGGASTLNISGLGAKTIKTVNGTAVNNGDIMAGWPLVLCFDGTDFRITAPTKNYIDQLVTSGAFPVNPGDAGRFVTNNGVSAFFGDTFGVAVNEKRGADIPASPTLNATAATGNSFHVTGTGISITAITIPDGAERVLIFDAVNTLVSSGSLVLPGGANITTAPGDVAIVRGDASGVARVVSYTRASGRAVTENVPPALVLLATVTPTAVIAIDFLNVFSATYDDYLVLYDGITITGTTLTIRLQLAKSGVVDAAAVYKAAQVSSATGGAASYFETSIAQASSGTPGTSFVARISNVNDSLANAFHMIDVAGCRATLEDTVTASHMIGGHFNGTSGSISGFRLSLPAGTFGATGKIRVYGYRKDV
jgi:hypothetical protein